MFKCILSDTYHVERCSNIARPIQVIDTFDIKTPFYQMRASLCHP